MRKAKASKTQVRTSQRARVRNDNERRSGIGTEFDFNTGQFVSYSNRLTPFQQDHYAVDLYYSDWAAKKIITIPVDDMLRHGWEYSGMDDEARIELETATDNLDVLDHFKTAMRLERLIGGSIIFMGIADGSDDPSIPVNYAELQKGCLKFLNVIPRSRVNKTTLDIDPLSPTFGRPLMYWVNGQKVHTSRMILFKGDPLLQAPDSSLMPTAWTRNDGFGVSVLMGVMDDLQRATGSRQAAYQLVQRASVFLFQTDTLDLAGSTEGDAKMRQMQDIINQINLFRGAVVDRAPGQTDPITTISPQFGSVPELVMTFLQILAAAADIPGARFFSQAPGGLNASDGGTSLENYFGRLESEQHQSLRPKLMKLLRVLGPSVLGEQYNETKVDIEFEPLWSLSALEQAQVRTADVTNVMMLQDVLTDAELLDELKQREVLKVDIERDAEVADENIETRPIEETLRDLSELPAV